MLFNIQPLLGTFIPLDLIALAIFLVRVGPRIASARWLEPGSSRHYAIAVPWAVVNILLTVWFVALFIGAKGDFTKLNLGILIGADHSIFLGVMTNMGFGLMHDFTKDRLQVWPWAEQLIFWMLNIALAGFVLSLITQQQWAEQAHRLLYSPIRPSVPPHPRTSAGVVVKLLSNLAPSAEPKLLGSARFLTSRRFSKRLDRDLHLGEGVTGRSLHFS